MVKRLKIVEISIFPKSIYRFNIILIIFWEFDMLNLKFENVYRNQRAWNIKIKFEKEQLQNSHYLILRLIIKL